jgi:hypothetical protein
MDWRTIEEGDDIDGDNSIEEDTPPVYHYDHDKVNAAGIRNMKCDYIPRYDIRWCVSRV